MPPTASFVPGIIRYSIDSSISFRFTKFFENVAFELSLVISLKSIRNIMWWCIFRLLISSQFSYNWMELSIYICKMIYHCKDIFKSISYTVWKKNCVSMNLFLGYKIHFVLLLHLSCFRKKKTSFCWSSFLWGLLLVFDFHLKVSLLKFLIQFCFAFYWFFKPSFVIRIYLTFKAHI